MCSTFLRKISNVCLNFFVDIKNKVNFVGGIYFFLII